VAKTRPLAKSPPREYFLPRALIVNQAKAERAPKTAIKTGMAKAGNSFFAWLALNFFARWLRRDRQSESRSCAALASAFLGFQFPIANDERKIADLVQHSARDLFRLT
jgi:hypothetical protein